MLQRKKNLILASGSPRRKIILTEAGFDFSVQPTEIDENYPEQFKTKEVPVYLAEKKARSFKEKVSGKIVLTADTIVKLGETILNKPLNYKDAKYYLKELSGKTHEVITGVCLLTEEGEESFYDLTKVHFRKLHESDIDYYITHYEPYDKAGAYAIQEWIGLIGIDSIEGSYFNVMGLPMHRIYPKITG